MCVKETFVTFPNLPQHKVTLAAVSGLYPEIPDALRHLGISCVTTVPDPRLPAPIAGHADIQMFHLNGNRTFVIKGEWSLKKQLEAAGFAVAETAAEPTAKYPGDVLCNALQLSDKLFANFGSMDALVYGCVENLGLRTVHVNQGYTRCASAVLNDHAIITMDIGIQTAAQFFGIDALRIDEHGILLDGYDYGFIGGCCGLIDKDVLAFTGRLDTLDSAPQIRAFLEKHHIRPVELTQNQMLDIGGILPLKELSGGD
ncbi:MAG: DUF6873 family GME fold protein [Hominenteromicrobium sp.]